MATALGPAAPKSGRHWHGPLARWLYTVAGAGAGLAIVWSSPSIGTQEWLVWAGLAVALKTASGAVFGYGLARWADLFELGSAPPSRRVGTYVAQGYGAALGLVALAFALGLATPEGASLATGGNARGPLLVTLAAIAALPVAACLAAVFEASRTLDAREPGKAAETLIALRPMLVGLLSALGTQVTLATLALGAARQIHDAQPEAVVIIFGAAWSAVIAIAYAPAAGAHRAAVRRLCRTVAPIMDSDAADLPERADARRKLELALGADSSTIADLQAGVLIFAPLLTSAASLFLPE